MNNDGTGLRDAELDARTIYDIACIRADASNATREDVEFKVIALRNYKAIAALSAVAPPPDWVLLPCEPTPEMIEAACETGCENGARGWREETSGGVKTILRGLNRKAYAAMLAASPAAPAQPDERRPPMNLPTLPAPLKQVAVAGYHDGTLKEPLEDYYDAEQMHAYAVAYAAALSPPVLEEVFAAIDAEPEFPSAMPDTMFNAIRDDKDAIEELMRIAVRATKRNIKARIAASPAAPAQQAVTDYQDRVGKWMDQCFPRALYGDMTQRCDRFLEEALELLQAMGYGRARVATLVDYVWGRLVGDPKQEVGGTVVTLAALCWVAGIDMQGEALRELARIEQPAVMAKIRAKQEAKNALHFDSPLPGTAALASNAAASAADAQEGV